MDTSPNELAAGSTDSRPPTASRWLLIPPPPLFIFALMLGRRLGRIVPVPLLPAALLAPAHLAGICAIVAGAALMIGAPLLFLRHRTTIIPQADARSMIVGGPYRLSRNPMYLGLTSAYLGVTLLTASLWPLLLLAFPLWVIQTKTIPFEERALTRLFGEPYRAYQRRVRRWI